MSKRVNIDVAVRIRPVTQPFKLLTHSQKQITIRNAKSYRFSTVLSPTVTQSQVFDQCKITSVIDNVVEGYNSTVLAFGQTGAGKTYTMEGSSGSSGSSGKPDPNTQGMIPRAIKVLFQKMAEKKMGKFKVSCTFLQIYNQRIYDLLSTNLVNTNPFSATVGDFSSGMKAGLKMRWDRENQFSVEHLQTRTCSDQQQMLKIWADGLKNRVVASTRLNLSSSRSHTIFTIRLLMPEQMQNSCYSRLQFVDLAGSERIMGEGKLARQSIDINKSLFALRKVINSLQNKQSFIPYRESKLTSLLKQSFGGNNYCLFLACVNPGDGCIEESVSTLAYATKASTIENRVEKRSDKRDIVIEELKRENQTLRGELASCYRQIQVLNRFNMGKPQQQQQQQQSQQFERNLKDITVEVPTYKEVAGEGGSATQFADRSNFTRYKQQVRIDYEYFGERLVESINTVRQLLKSNKKLRQQLDLQRDRCQQYSHQIQQLMIENQRLRLTPTHQLSSPQRDPLLLMRQFSSKREQKPPLLNPNSNFRTYRKPSTFKTRTLRLNTQTNIRQSTDQL